jgi:esterase/lipase superfamily enzyme
MQGEYHRWFTSRLNRDMGVLVYGHWGPPLLAFPTSGGDEWEHENQSMIEALADFVDGGRVKIFTVNATGDSFLNRGTHPLHRSYVQKQYDEYIRREVIPFVQHHCQSDVAISTCGASLGAYHAANTLFKYPDVVKRCFAMSGVYDMSRFMDGVYDDNFYFNNPVDYLSNLSDPWHLGHLASCDIHIVTGSGPWEDRGPSYRLTEVLTRQGIPHSLDDWGPEGGHDWPYWKRQMREYVGRLF